MAVNRYTSPNGEYGEVAAQICKHLNSKTPDELVDEMADKWDAMDENDFDPHLIDKYLTILDEKDTSAADYDATASLAVFREKHYHFFLQLESEVHSESANHRRPLCLHWRAVSLVGIAVILLFGCMITAQALGLNIFGAMARWTDDIFRFGSPDQTANIQISSESTGSDMEYSSLADALQAYGISEPITPNWYPLEFSLTDIKAMPSSEVIKFQANYETDNRFYAITIRQYSSIEDTDSGTFEKDNSSVIVYERNGINHYLMTNNGQIRAVWINQSIMCSISGDLSEDELKRMIDSIYEG